MMVLLLGCNSQVESEKHNANSSETPSPRTSVNPTSKTTQPSNTQKNSSAKLNLQKNFDSKSPGDPDFQGEQKPGNLPQGNSTSLHANNRTLSSTHTSTGQSAHKKSIDDYLLFHPAKYPVGNWSPIQLIFQDVWFQAKDGTRIHGWYCPAENSRAVLLYAHGNAGNLSHRAGLLVTLQKMKVTTLIFDYRGYGKSLGEPSKGGVLEDARAARLELSKLATVKESEIILMGRSLGGAVAVQLAAEQSPKGLILESTFPSLFEIASHHYPKLAWMVDPKSFHSVNAIAKYKGPLLQSHGDQDRVIPLDLGEKLYGAANQPKQFYSNCRGNS